MTTHVSNIKHTGNHDSPEPKPNKNIRMERNYSDNLTKHLKRFSVSFNGIKSTQISSIGDSTFTSVLHLLELSNSLLLLGSRFNIRTLFQFFMVIEAIAPVSAIE